MRDFAGKVAFITGGASGIGFGMARAFLSRGMKVVIADVNETNLAEAKAALAGNNQVHFVKVDVTDRDAMARAADETVRVFGKVHVLCNNAGTGRAPALDEAAYEDWDHVMGVNLGGVINGVMSFVPKIKAHGEGGHIVNTSSMAGLIPVPGRGGIYSASKFAVRGVSDSLRLNLAKDGIGVSTLFPGLTRSRMSQAATRPGYDGAPDEGTPGMDPLELAEAVMRGIERNDPYILPHGEFKEEVEGLFRELLDLFPDSYEADEGRMTFEENRRKATEAAKKGLMPKGGY